MVVPRSAEIPFERIPRPGRFEVSVLSRTLSTTKKMESRIITTVTIQYHRVFFRLYRTCCEVCVEETTQRRGYNRCAMAEAGVVVKMARGRTLFCPFVGLSVSSSSADSLNCAG